MDSDSNSSEPSAPKRPPLREATLYLVATPLGNLEDITLRACRTLNECSLVAAEDTRRTGLLLQHLGFKKPLISFHKFNEAKRIPELLRHLGQGDTLSLVSDAGTPGISDPGERLVAAVIEAGYRVESVPGPCALITALAVSGLPTSSFYFDGFLPQKGAARRKRLSNLLELNTTLTLYESPYRVLKLLDDLADLAPDRRVVVARELTKKFEEILRGSASELIEQFKNKSIKGEFVVMIESRRKIKSTNPLHHEPESQ